MLKKDNIFVIKYSIKMIGQNKEIITHEILPKRLGWGTYNQLQLDYNIRLHAQEKRIIHVENRRFGKVKFEAIHVDDESGYVLGSKFKIWTS